MEKYKNKIPKSIYSVLEKKGFKNLRPSQEKSIESGLFENNSLLVCTPTASGKTLVGELGILNAISRGKKGLYIVPLRALASEKYKHFKKEYPNLKVGIGSGDIDSEDKYLNYSDIIIATSEKVDSLIRHKANWLKEVGCLVIDEIHLLNDHTRGPTLEIVITILKRYNLQIIGLSATIGNPEELASWLEANLVEDSWRPTELKQAVVQSEEVYFVNNKENLINSK